MAAKKKTSRKSAPNQRGTSKRGTRRSTASRGGGNASGPTDAKSGMPPCRSCATDQVHERLLRSAPGYADARASIENYCWRAAHSRTLARSGCTVIPVVVHVLHRTAAENISKEQIDSQIAVLNRDFRKKNPDVADLPAVFAPLAGDARIEFELATEDPDGNPTDGIVRRATSVAAFSHDDAMKSAASGGSNAWPRDRYLNIWVCTLGGGLLGYAQFPGGPAATDGVVILNRAFGTTGTAAAPFDQGRTTTHEIGHWLNLRHIWGDDGTGCSGSDFVADTPNQGGSNTGKPTFPRISCGNGPNGDLFMNYMDYVDDDTMIMFTAGQVERMHATLDSARSTIGRSKPCDPIEPTLITEDLATPTNPAVDTPPTLAQFDKPTLAVHDIQPTLTVLDRPPTLAFFDRPPTLAFLDQPPTLSFLDQPPTHPILDQGSLKFRDDVKLPGLDLGGPPGLGGLGGLGGTTQQPFPAGQATPFVLATGHHSNAWVDSFPGIARQHASQLEQQIGLLHEQLQQAAHAAAAGLLTAADQAQVTQMQQELERLVAEYQAMGGAR